MLKVVGLTYGALMGSVVLIYPVCAVCEVVKRVRLGKARYKAEGSNYDGYR